MYFSIMDIAPRQSGLIMALATTFSGMSLLAIEWLMTSLVDYPDLDTIVLSTLSGLGILAFTFILMFNTDQIQSWSIKKTMSKGYKRKIAPMYELTT